MLHDLDTTERSTRDNTTLNRPTQYPKPVLAGEKDFYDPASPADFHEYLIVLAYTQH